MALPFCYILWWPLNGQNAQLLLSSATTLSYSISVIKGVDGTTSNHIKTILCDADQYRMAGAKCARDRASSGTPSFCATLTEISFSK